MKITNVFIRTAKAYYQGYTTIINRGSSRSSKTYSELQLIYSILKNSEKKRIATVVSHSLPHLEGGAIRDFDKILESEGINLDDVKTKRPYVYKIGISTLEFIGFDKPGKALGAARDILFMNEVNKMSFDICQHLMIRTVECTFMDYNPSNEFWVDDALIGRNDVIVIDSNFHDNKCEGKTNLTKKQLNEFYEAKQKHDIEVQRGIKGYWYNWWRVYGLGLKGSLEGVIFNNWKEVEEMPENGDYYRLFGVDFGGNDPTVIVELWIDKREKKVYVHEHLYKSPILVEKVIDKILEINSNNDEVICDSARTDLIYQFNMSGIIALPSMKGSGSIIAGIDIMQMFEIFITKDSLNTIDEFKKYSWVKKDDKFIDKPEDKNNHAIDSIRYALNYYYRNFLDLYQ